MESEPEDTAHLLTESGRSSIDTINNLPDESLLENGNARESSWPENGEDEVKSVSTKHLILLTGGTFG